MFESDVHRRVLAALPADNDTPVAFEYAVRPILDDQNIPFYVADDETLTDLKQVLDGLIADGFATFNPEDRLTQRTELGTSALAAPSPHEPDTVDAAAVADREAANTFKAAVDARRQAADRKAANEAAIEEINVSIADDTAVVEAPEPERPEVSDPKAIQVLAAVDEIKAKEEQA